MSSIDIIKTVTLSTFVYSTLVTAAGLGQWGPTIEFPIVPVATALLHDTGELLVWSAYSPSTFQVDKAGYTQSAVYSPSNGTVNQYTISNTGHDMFCPGISIDFNGRITVTGGDTANKTTIYVSAPETWTAGGLMNIPRGYQSSATCSDGRIFTIGGSWSGGYGGKNGEIFNPSTNSWSLLKGCPVAPMLTADAQGAFRTDNHGWLFGWKNGYVLQAGPSKAMNWYGTSGSGSQTAAGKRASDPDSMNGNAVMYDAVAGKIATFGGSPSYQYSYATSNAHIITIGTPPAAPSVATINNMNYARAFANAIILPSGSVFIVGGQTYPIPFSDANSTLTPELWDPVSTKFTKMAVGPTPRNYHSVGLLMPDGTVFSGGGGLCGDGCAQNHFDGQFYSPPYLFQADGTTKATRPVITNVSASTIRVGANITVTTGGAVSSFALMRIGSATHTVNTDQRRVPLTAASTSGFNYTLKTPTDAGVLLPGYWMLFVLDANGVPSVATTVKITL
ncbi:copper radical oxidase [Viridothelium virens]|uniref:Copper radical oxidase n=1 Tax=Viridothelium virens TaxID=1048519 RepID=A0A6A6H4C2_VIRVR|nr:copper radical oxidase [Viridothelium virens]